MHPLRLAQPVSTVYVCLALMPRPRGYQAGRQPRSLRCFRRQTRSKHGHDYLLFTYVDGNDGKPKRDGWLPTDAGGCPRAAPVVSALVLPVSPPTQLSFILSKFAACDAPTYSKRSRLLELPGTRRPRHPLRDGCTHKWIVWGRKTPRKRRSTQPPDSELH